MTVFATSRSRVCVEDLLHDQTVGRLRPTSGPRPGAIRLSRRRHQGTEGQPGRLVCEARGGIDLLAMASSWLWLMSAT